MKKDKEELENERDGLCELLDDVVEERDDLLKAQANRS